MEHDTTDTDPRTHPDAAEEGALGYRNVDEQASYDEEAQPARDPDPEDETPGD